MSWCLCLTVVLGLKFSLERYGDLSVVECLNHGSDYNSSSAFVNAMNAKYYFCLIVLFFIYYIIIFIVIFAITMLMMILLVVST